MSRAARRIRARSCRSVRWRILVRVLKADFPGITQVVGHRDLSPDLDGDGVVEPDEWTKACPCFEVKREL